MDKLQQDESSLLNAKQVQELLNIKNIKTVYRYAKKGLIPSIPFGSRNIKFRYKDVKNIQKNGIDPYSNINLGTGNSKRFSSGRTRTRRKLEWKR